MPSIEESTTSHATSTAVQRQHAGRHTHGHQRQPSLSLVTPSGTNSGNPRRHESPQRYQHPSSASALLSLSQDITALVSLSFEATASLVNDYARSALGTIGLGERVVSTRKGGSESGAGLAIVVVGAADPAGQSLTLRLAKSGYTVFPFVPILAPTSIDAVPVSHPLSTLLLAWSSVQKRLQSRDPGHTGAVVPVVIDDSGDAFLSNTHTHTPSSPPKRSGRFSHAGDTVRHYCRESGLALVAIVCAAPTSIPPPPRAPSPPTNSPLQQVALIPGVDDSGLAHADEEYLLSLYRAHILDPISIIRSLGDLLGSPRSTGGIRGRVLFVGSSGSLDNLENAFETRNGAERMIAAARAEATTLLRAELGGAGIDVCEIAVGPMAPRLLGPRHIRSGSGDSDTDRALAASNADGPNPTSPGDDALASRLRLLARIFAVDDALVYSCVRRAIEDRYPRARHHAGLAPLITSVVNATPGSGIVRYLGRWVLGRLFRPKQ